MLHINKLLNIKTFMQHEYNVFELSVVNIRLKFR